MQCNARLIRLLMIGYLPPDRFRAGFQQVFVCCAPTIAQEELELKSPRYLQTQVCVRRHGAVEKSSPAAAGTHGSRDVSSPQDRSCMGKWKY